MILVHMMHVFYVTEGKIQNVAVHDHNETYL